MLYKKDFVCRNLYGENFDSNPYGYGYNFLSASQNLSSAGKSLLKKFIDQNREKERAMAEKEEQLYKEYHSKRNYSAMNIVEGKRGVESDLSKDGNGKDSLDDKNLKKSKPFWRNGLHVIGEFGPPMFDRYHLYDEPIKRKYKLVQPPFRRPKDEGDYFDKDIHILGGPYEKVEREKVIS